MRNENIFTATSLFLNMDFGKLREKKVEIRKYRKLSKTLGCFFKNVECLALAVIKMTTANGRHLTFSWKHSKFFIISDRYRDIMEFVEVYTEIARNVSKSITPPITLFMWCKHDSPRRVPIRLNHLVQNTWLPFPGLGAEKNNVNILIFYYYNVQIFCIPSYAPLMSLNRWNKR